MPRLTETYAGKIPQSKSGTDRHWDTEVRGLVLYVGKKSKTWYYQKDVGGQTKRALIGRYPTISADAARWGRGAGKQIQIAGSSKKSSGDC